MAIELRYESEASPSASEYGASLFSIDSIGKRPAYSGFTTPGSTRDVNQQADITSNLAAKNLALLSFGSYFDANLFGLNHRCHHDILPDKFHTCSHPYHSSYNEGNLPLLLFRLEAPKESHSEPIGYLVENGKVVLDYQGNPVRNFPFLPRYISVKPSGWLVEFWMRSDTRLTYRDIKARMTAKNEELPSDNVLNMRRERDARKPLGLSCWTARRGGITKAELERVERLSSENVKYNTSLKVRFDLQPAALESRSFDPNAMPQYYPLDIFLDHPNELHNAGHRLEDSIELLFRLQVLASDLGLNDWKDLPENELPQWWPKAKGKANADLTSVNQSQLSSASGSVLSTPRSVSKRRMSWKTPPKSRLSVAFTAETPECPTQSASPFMNAISPSADFFTGDTVGATGYTDQFDTIAHRTDINNALAANYSELGMHQPLQGLGVHQLWTSPISGLNGQNVEIATAYNESTVVSRQANFFPAPFQGCLDDYHLFDGPYISGYSTPYNQAASTEHLDNIAMQIDQRCRASNYPQGINKFSPSPSQFRAPSSLSIRRNHAHKVNTSTGEIMTRNNPFPWRRHQRNMSSQRSFENFLRDNLPY
ncbi:hypothetical protein D8B26_005798 [Coccidioides posadasii str. Silveira]|uniref:Uncharacterized protein n=1 Tax=Coccidioides posadasii (strain RMSCC 757 / Silveira) TaxID=443226 RepID=E9DAY8_COCPS|nr:conserved hypothetical protein [Coccidioides posadasii str. Silveira]QVM11147.1 hypothetical protein D8B26_005798 [Coccidioides posadasii str. Silveira]